MGNRQSKPGDRTACVLALPASTIAKLQESRWECLKIGPYRLCLAVDTHKGVNNVSDPDAHAMNYWAFTHDSDLLKQGSMLFLHHVQQPLLGWSITTCERVLVHLTLLAILVVRLLINGFFISEPFLWLAKGPVPSVGF